MKLSLNEVRKQLSGRLMLGVLALLVILNMAFCYFFTDSRTNEELLSAMKVADEVYQQSSEEIDANHQLYKEMVDAYQTAIEEWEMLQIGAVEESTMTEPPVEPNIPSTYYEGMDDYELFSLYFDRLLTEDRYREQITADLDTAMQTLKHYKSNGYSVDSYVYRQQIRYLETYQRALEQVEITEGYAYGWDVLFAYSGTGLFIFLMAIFMGSRLYQIEQDTGMHLLLRSTRHGRGGLAGAKMLASLGLAFLITLLFTASSMLVIGWKIGFSSPLDAVQQIGTMFYCPFPLSMLTCLLLTVAMTVLAAFALLQLTACLSLALRRSLLAMLCAAVLVGGSYYCFGFGKLYFLKYVNLFTAVSAEVLLGNWRAVHVFTHPISQLIPLTILLLVLLILAASIGGILWNSVGVGAAATKQNRLLARVSALAEKLPCPRGRSLRLAAHERQKLLPRKMVVLCVILILLKVVLSVTAFDGELTYQDEIKLSYMEQYSQLSLQEASDAVNERLARYNEISAPSYVTDQSSKWLNGEITADEYYAFRTELSEARIHTKTLSGFADELDYLSQKEAETGISAKPVSATGYRKLMQNDFEPILVAILLLLFCGCFAREYETGIIKLLRSTKRGRMPIFFTKIAYVAGVSLICALGFTLLDAGLVFANYNMDCIHSPLFAITTYRNTASGLTIGQYLLLTCAFRLLSYTLLGLLIAALSGTLRSEWSAAGVTLLLFIPYLLTGIGLTVFEPFDFTLALSGDRLYLLSTSIGQGGGLWLMGIVMGAWTAITILLTVRSKRQFCN